MSDFLNKFKEQNPDASFPFEYKYDHDGATYTVYDGDKYKICEASDGSYNYTFNKRTGDFARWGRTYEEDPDYSPIGPEILDFEISSVEEKVKHPNRVITQNGKCQGVGCQNFCYKQSQLSNKYKITYDDGTSEILCGDDKIKLNNKDIAVKIAYNSVFF